MYKVIFDRSIFHGEKFDARAKDCLTRCVEENKLKIFYTRRFIEETLQFFDKDKVTFENQWKLLIQFNRTAWFKAPDDIVAAELGSNDRTSKYYFQSAEEIQKTIEGVKCLLREQYSLPKYQAALEECTQIRSKRQQFRETRKQWRTDGKSIGKNFDEYFESEIEKFIQDFITKHNNSSEYLNNWRTNRKACAFTETYVRSLLALVHLAKTNTNRQSKIDPNDEPDAEQLAYLIWCDFFVSDDTNFMKACFDLLYSGKSKKFMTLQEFLEFLELKI